MPGHLGGVPATTACTQGHLQQGVDKCTLYSVWEWIGRVGELQCIALLQKTAFMVTSNKEWANRWSTKRRWYHVELADGCNKWDLSRAISKELITVQLIKNHCHAKKRMCIAVCNLQVHLVFLHLSEKINLIFCWKNYLISLERYISSSSRFPKSVSHNLLNILQHALRKMLKKTL